MFRLLGFLGVLGLVVGTADSAPLAKAGAVAEVNAVAPDFTLKNTNGEEFRLSSFKGKTVVLEWFNPDCPFVKHAYQDGPLAGLPKLWLDREVVWVGVNSGAAGKQGAGAERNKKARVEWEMPHQVLLDGGGEVGRAYGAKTTPQIVVIDEAGVVRYNGALDNQPMGRGKGDLQVYTDEVLTALTAGKPSPHARTKPYGCSVKY